MKKELYILDVSGFIFRAYFALPPMSNAKGEATHALFGFIRSVIKLFKDFAPEHIVAVFDGPDNKKQRKEIYEKYKENRSRILDDLPEQIDKAKQFCALIGIPEVEVPGVEADDTMGSIAKWAAQEGLKVFVLTSDKDLAQIVDQHIFLLNPWKDNLIIDRQEVEKLYGVPPEKIIDLLAMMGDASDNIPGVKGIGPKTAIQLLEEFHSVENIYSHIDKITGKKQQLLIDGKENALLSKKLATIHTDIPFPKEKDFFSKKDTQISEIRSFYLDMGFNSLIKELDTLFGATKSSENHFYHIIDDIDALEILLEKLSLAKEIAIDTETNILPFMVAELVGVGFCIAEGEAYYVPLNGLLGKERVINKLKPILENSKLSFFGHNVKYDYHILLNEGIELKNIGFDTILASYLLKSASRSHSLDELAIQHFGKVKIPIKSLIGSGKKEISMKDVPIPDVGKYCCEDVDYTFRLKELLEKELSAKTAISSLFYKLELPLSEILANMERRGIYVDTAQLQEMSLELSKDISRLETEIYSLAGETFNISSPKQLSYILFEKMKIKPVKKTTTGFSTNVEVLETLASNHLIAVKIIEYRALEKLRSTYIDSLPINVNPKTKRIHPSFNQLGTTTGRLSCQDPNLQNIPVKTPMGRKIREAFCPQKTGWKFLAADYSQIELRLLAHLSEDANLIKAFKQGEDIHAYTASLVLGIPISQITKEMRNQAKAINFGIVYGQQAYGLSQQLGIDIHMASDFIKAYFERYPGVQAYIATCIELGRKFGKTTTMLGREREIPEIHSQNAMMRAAAERLAINTPLQGSAADLIKQAMLNIDHLLKKRGMDSFMILQIHDELIFEAPSSEIEELTVLVKDSMENVCKLLVPLVVDVTVGKNWGEC